VRLIDSCITHLKAQGPSRTCNESKEEEEEAWVVGAKEKRPFLALHKSIWSPQNEQNENFIAPFSGGNSSNLGAKKTRQPD